MPAYSQQCDIHGMMMFVSMFASTDTSDRVIPRTTPLLTTQTDAGGSRHHRPPCHVVWRASVGADMIHHVSNTRYRRGFHDTTRRESHLTGNNSRVQHHHSKPLHPTHRRSPFIPLIPCPSHPIPSLTYRSFPPSPRHHIPRCVAYRDSPSVQKYKVTPTTVHHTTHHTTQHHSTSTSTVQTRHGPTARSRRSAWRSGKREQGGCGFVHVQYLFLAGVSSEMIPECIINDRRRERGARLIWGGGGREEGMG